jgi:Lar family restriction alleviation protein
MKLLPCPFCGGEAEFERLGTRRQSCIVVCIDCGCRLESADQDDNCGVSWNTRHENK